MAPRTYNGARGLGLSWSGCCHRHLPEGDDFGASELSKLEEVGASTYYPLPGRIFGCLEDFYLRRCSGLGCHGRGAHDGVHGGHLWRVTALYRRYEEPEEKGDACRLLDPWLGGAAACRGDAHAADAHGRCLYLRTKALEETSGQQRGGDKSLSLPGFDFGLQANRWRKDGRGCCPRDVDVPKVAQVGGGSCGRRPLGKALDPAVPSTSDDWWRFLRLTPSGQGAGAHQVMMALRRTQFCSWRRGGGTSLNAMVNEVGLQADRWGNVGGGCGPNGAGAPTVLQIGGGSRGRRPLGKALDPAMTRERKSWMCLLRLTPSGQGAGVH